MGWSKGGYIFDPVAKRVVMAVERRNMTRDAGVDVLTELAAALSAEDWDTWEESLEEADHHPVVVDALREADLLYCEDPLDQEWHERCHPSLPCGTLYSNPPA